MPDYTFTPPVAPSFPLEDAREPRVLRPAFGDGYAARVRDGLHHDLETISLKWENLTYAEYKPIWDFLVARGGDQAFNYTIPFDVGFSNGTQKIYTCPQYARTRPEAGSWMITATFKEVPA